ncbi:MAG: MerR family transcriptional regulator [Gemmatimonadales bacterium]
MTAPQNSPEAATLSIGALSAATGIPADTLRTWERRYGYPTARRKPSGHRVYPFVVVERLRRIGELIALGHRAGDVVGASDEALQLLANAGPLMALSTTHSPSQQSAPLHQLLSAVASFDTTTLRRSFEFDWAHRGPIDFMQDRAGLLLAAVGRAWEVGDLDVRHEHVASACLGDFLRSVRAPLDRNARGPTVVLTTLAGEQHGLGVQMCATVLALVGWRTVIAGVNTPSDQIAMLARETGARAVAISAVQPGVKDLAGSMTSLRQSLPARVALLVGGSGIPVATDIPGVLCLRDLRALDTWARGAGRTGRAR